LFFYFILIFKFNFNFKFFVLGWKDGYEVDELNLFSQLVSS